MKTYIFILIIILLASCKEIQHPKAFTYCTDIIFDPNKIYNLKINYPNIYNDSIISKDLMDSTYLTKMKDYISLFFNKNKDDLDYSFFTDQKVDRKTILETQQYILQSNNSIKFENYDEIFAHKFY